MNGFPVRGDGFRADVVAGEHRLRLFSEVYELGHVAVVYDMDAQREIARNDADDLNDGMRRAEQAAADYLRHLDGTVLRVVNWEMNAQMRARLPQ
jgi:hypothetical protein